MMKRRTARLPAAVLLAALAATVGFAQEHEEMDAVTAPTWSVELSGLRTHTLRTYEVRELAEATALATTVTVEERGESVEYTGVPLSAILGFVDGVDFEDPWQLDSELWLSGYDVTVTAMDGYAATFNTADYDPAAIVFATARGGEAVNPRLTGDVSRKLWVRDVVSIEAALEAGVADEARQAFEFQLTVNGESVSYSLAEMQDLSLFVREQGQYTTSAGSVYGGTWGGVLLRQLLEQFVVLEPDTAVTFVATDGYEMTYSGEQVTDESDGHWILAIELDGEALPVDPGYIRTIKVGPDNPDIPGHLSVRMIAQITVEGDEFEDFALEILGQMDHVLDRSTLQSNMAFTGTTVTFTHRGETNEYTGIPLHELLAFADDPLYAPHRQDSSIDPYNREAAVVGYPVTITATDGFSITLDSRELHENDLVILALEKNGEVLPENEWPLIVVWDESLDPPPAGIRNVRNVAKIELGM